MTGPVLISPKVTPIEAFQFTGGRQNADAIDAWLDTKLAAQSRRGAVAVQLVPAVDDVFEETGEGQEPILIQNAAPEILAIFTTGGRQRVEVGNWIVLDPVSIFKVVTPDTIDSDYDIEETA